jgi:HD-GYP domain-containing protein (c-di-GMP phosphodiesterase class II)
LAEQALKGTLEEAANQQNHYAENLAEVNKRTDVIATQDIYNENGLLVASKGTHINHEVSDLIVQQKLVQPLEEQVQLEKALSSNGLNEGFKSIMDKYPDLEQVHSAHKFQTTIDRLFESIDLHPILLQELTVMQECLPEHYEKTLLCAWLSTLIGKELGMQEDLLRNVFLGGLAHDIGMLHISPDIIKKKETLTPDEWRAMQCHVVVGQLMLKKIYSKTPDVARAVFEHHERCDGSGYPLGKTNEMLDVSGQIIAMADTIQAIRINRFAKCGRNLSNVLPCIKMSQYAHFLKVYNAVCTIILKAGLVPLCVNPFGDINSLVIHLMSQGTKLHKAVALLEKVLEQTELIDDGHAYRKIIKAAIPVVLMSESSGLVKKEVLDWLPDLQNNTDETDLNDLIEMDLLQNELNWQLRNVCKVIDDSLNTEDSNNISEEHKENLESISKQINEILK